VGVFFVAAAARKDPKRAPDKFKEFVGVFEVEVTGEILSDWSIETKIGNSRGGRSGALWAQNLRRGKGASTISPRSTGEVFPDSPAT
jgi:hypothetical protein